MPAAPLGPLSGLAPLPSPTAGNIGPNPMPGMLDGVNNFAQAMAQKRERDKKDAEAKLPMLLQLAKAQPDNPQVQAALQDALGKSGLPVLRAAPPSNTDPAATGAGAAVGSGAPGAPVDTPGAAPRITQAKNAPAQPFSGPAGPTGSTTQISPGQTGPAGLPAAASLPTIGTDALTPPHGELPPGASPEQATHHGLLGGLWDKLHPHEQASAAAGASQNVNPIDVDAYMPQKLANESQAQYLMALEPGASREAGARIMGVNLPKGAESLAAVYPPGSKEYAQAQNEFDNFIKLASTQGVSSQTALAFLTAHEKQFGAAGILGINDPSESAALSALSTKLQSEIAANKLRGLHYSNEDQRALENAPSLIALRQAQTRFANEHTKILPEQMRLAMQRESDLNQHRADDLNARVTHWKAQEDQIKASGGANAFRGFSAMLGSVREADSTIRQATADIESDTRARTTQLEANGADETDPAITQLDDRIKQNQQNRDEATALKARLESAVQSPAGLTAALQGLGASTSFAPNAPPAAPPAAASPAASSTSGQPQTQIKNGKTYYLWADGHYHARGPQSN